MAKTPGRNPYSGQLKNIKSIFSSSSAYPLVKLRLPQPINVDDRIKQARANLENKDYEQDIELKRKTLWILFGFLAIETIFIFLFSYWQASTEWFQLDEWSFRLLVSATIGQITYMVQLAVKHLFPTKRPRRTDTE